MKRALVLVTGTIAWLTAAGCESVENTISCADVCNRYQECFDDDYDVSGCTDRCEDEASADEEKEAKLEACDECIEDRSCASAVFSCTTECAGVIIN
jgi:hypothetical protein